MTIDIAIKTNKGFAITRDGTVGLNTVRLTGDGKFIRLSTISVKGVTEGGRIDLPAEVWDALATAYLAAREKTRVIVEVEGGCVQGVYTDLPLEIRVVDQDEESDGETILQPLAAFEEV